MKDFLVLTSDIGGKDRLTDPDIIFDSCDYVAITDRNYGTKIWTEYPFYQFSSIDRYAHRRDAKLYKLLSTILFPQYKYIIWHDANQSLIMDPVKIIEEYGDADYFLIKHSIRNCLYDEIDVCSRINYDNVHVLESQKRYYSSRGFPRNYGLYAMGHHIKKISPLTTVMDLKWWEQVCKYSSRDQCSFVYCLWDMEMSNRKLNIKILPGLDSDIASRTHNIFRNKGTRLY